MLRRDNHTNLLFLPPPSHHPIHPPPLLTLDQRLKNLEYKLTAMESTTTKEHEKNILATAIDKINTFLENAGAWNKKLDELFKDSQSHAQLAPDMTDSDQEHC